MYDEIQSDFMLSDEEKLEIVNYWFSGKDFENYMKLPPNSKYTKDNITEIIVGISSGGAVSPAHMTMYRDKLIKKIQEKQQLNFSKISMVISILAILISIIAYFISAPYQQQTLPKLSIVKPTELLKLSAQKLGDKDYISAQFTNGGSPWERVEFCLKNTGRTDSGHVNLQIKNEFLNDDIGNISNVESGKQPACDTIILRQKYCGQPDFDQCKKEELPKGKLKLLLEISCLNCQPQVTLHEIDVCISHNSGNECN